MNSIYSSFFVRRLWMIILIAPAFLLGCEGGAIVFEAGSAARVDIDENNAGVVWMARASVAGAPNSVKLTYELKGADADALSINPVNGSVSFKTPADFEQPVDADKNNEYVFSVEAKADGKAAVQQVTLQVKNITQPVVELIKPQPFENVGTGATVEVETLVKFYDAESNTPFVDGSITLNSMPMEAAGEDAKIWKSKIAVAEGGINLDITASASSVGALNLKERLLNKRNSAPVSHVWAIKDKFMLVSWEDNSGYFDLDTRELESFDRQPFFFYNFAFPGSLGGKCLSLPVVCYTFSKPLSEREYLVLLSIDYFFESSGLRMFIPTNRLAALEFPKEVIDLALDETHRRIISLSRTSDSYIFSWASLDDNGAPVGVRTTPLFSLPQSVYPVGYKQFSVHGSTGTFIFAEEKQVNGIARTVIRGFGEDGAQRFEAELVGRASNFVVHEKTGLIYVAENSDSYRAKIKSIDIVSGVVADVLNEGAMPQHGAFSGLGIDQINDRIYVGDSVSYSLYMVDLANKTMRELPYTHVLPPPPSGHED